VGTRAHPISDVTFDHVDLVFQGRGGLPPSAVPTDNSVAFDPDRIGPRPSYGLYVHQAEGVTIEDSQLGLVSRDNRPSIVIDEALTFDRLMITGNPHVVLTGVTRFASPAAMGVTVDHDTSVADHAAALQRRQHEQVLRKPDSAGDGVNNRFGHAHT
jgi:hypothetical protein